MMMFSFVEADYTENVFLPEKNICLSFVYSGYFDKHLFYVKSYIKGNRIYNFSRFHRHGIVPALYNYKALPYKRQSSIDLSDTRFLCLKNSSFGFPWSHHDHTSLNKIKSFYMNCKRNYVVIAYRKGSQEEKVLLTFDRYSDAISVLRDFTHTRIRSLLGSDFETYNSWYPYLWVEYMSHPISLLSEIGSHVGSHLLGSAWFDYLLCFLRNGSVERKSFSSVFGCVYKDEFSKVINWNSK